MEVAQKRDDDWTETPEGALALLTPTDQFPRNCYRGRNIIQRFGRFPHRNPMLGRITTTDEIKFLKEIGFQG